MVRYYKKLFMPINKDETDLPRSEYLRFLKIWEIFILVADVMNISGSAALVDIEVSFITLSALYVARYNYVFTVLHVCK